MMKKKEEIIQRALGSYPNRIVKTPKGDSEWKRLGNAVDATIDTYSDNDAMWTLLHMLSFPETFGKFKKKQDALDKVGVMTALVKKWRDPIDYTKRMSVAWDEAVRDKLIKEEQKGG